MNTFQSDESQATLVNPKPHFILHFKPWNPCNSTLYRDEETDPCIQIKMKAPVTVFTDLRTSEVLATTKFPIFGADTVQFPGHYGGKQMNIKTWLKEEVVDHQAHIKAWTIETPAGKFTWRRGNEHRLSLFPHEDPTHPIAWVLSTQESGRPFALQLNRIAESFQELILVSLSIIEQYLEIKEQPGVGGRSHNDWDYPSVVPGVNNRPVLGMPGGM